MANVDRRWLPPILITGAGVASLIAQKRLPPTFRLDLNGLFPWFTPPSEPGPRWIALWLMPAVALLLWIGFRLAPTAAGERLGRRLFRNAPDEVTAPAQFDRFGKTYETIVLAIVLIILGFHAGFLAAAFHANLAAVRTLLLVLGASLALLGNVMPRLRPNWVAGLRTQRLLSDPQEWRRAHRTFGTAIFASGIVTMLAAIAAPRYGLLVGIGGMLVSCLVGLTAVRTRGKGTPRAHTAALCILVLLSVGQRDLAAQSGYRSRSVRISIRSEHPGRVDARGTPGGHDTGQHARREENRTHAAEDRGVAR
jgi:hypothetical protein